MSAWRVLQRLRVAPLPVTVLIVLALLLAHPGPVDRASSARPATPVRTARIAPVLRNTSPRFLSTIQQRKLTEALVSQRAGERALAKERAIALARAQRQARIAALARRRERALLHQNLSLHGVGTQLYTAWNQPITLKAINWYGFEYAPFVAGGLDHAPLDSILWTVKHWGFNALRIMYADATVQWNPIVRQRVAANPQLRGLRSLDIMQRILERAQHFGLRVILCNSRSEPGMGPELKTGLWYTQQFPASVWQQDWITLTERFRHISAFVGADLRNEPHIIGSQMTETAMLRLGPLWGAYNGAYYHDKDWHYAAQTMGNALLRIDPNLLIVVEGIQLYHDPYRNQLTGALWGSNLIGVQYDQVVLDRPSQLVYSVHEYGPRMWRGQWFNANTSYTTLSQRWDYLWGYLLKAPRFMQAPILVGEFGTCDDWYSCISNAQKPWSQGAWFQDFERYLLAHPQVSWAYWALNPDGPFKPDQRDFYSLMQYDWHHVHRMLVYGLSPLLGIPHVIPSWCIHARC